MDLRCKSKKHAVLIEPAMGGVIEIKCDSRFCGASREQIVLHRFDTMTGDMVTTLVFANPSTQKVSQA